GHWPGESRKLLAGIWPAALTAVLPSSGQVPGVLSPRGKVAVRIPAFGELRKLIKAVGESIVSTSVNVTGGKSLTRIDEIKKTFLGLDAYVSQRGRPRVSPSTVVDFSVFPPRRIRTGGHI
ncbi:MAG: Sua5/YciO/YrdC/YwlC family protein, partial [Candidatus Krumholzibacteria bacterium]|nr:Sua5/YciO/YrdC/YwlC family protein [Candidatus Krumholzibacteria bacterium]